MLTLIYCGFCIICGGRQVFCLCSADLQPMPLKHNTPCFQVFLHFLASHSTQHQVANIIAQGGSFSMFPVSTSIIIMNKRGLRADPWGNPTYIGKYSVSPPISYVIKKKIQVFHASDVVWQMVPCPCPPPCTVYAGLTRPALELISITNVHTISRKMFWWNKKLSNIQSICLFHRSEFARSGYFILLHFEREHFNSGIKNV